MENIKTWLKKNLFSNWYYSLITIFILYVLFSTIPTFLDWAFFKATFIGNTKSDCKSGGACWVFIKVWFDKLVLSEHDNSIAKRILIGLFFGLAGDSFLMFVDVNESLFVGVAGSMLNWLIDELKLVITNRKFWSKFKWNIGSFY